MKSNTSSCQADVSRDLSLEPLVQDLRERINSLKSFNRDSAVHAYCDDLQSEVQLTVESAIKHLHELQDELIAEINSYRDSLLQEPSATVPVSSPQRHVTSASSGQNSEAEKALIQAISALLEQWKKEHQLLTQADEFQLDLALVSSSVDAFVEKCSAYSTTQEPSVYETNSMKEEGKYLKTRIVELRKRQRSQAFQGKFLKFKPNHLFALERDHLGELETLTKEPDPIKKASLIISKDPVKTIASLVEPASSLSVSDGALVIMAKDGVIYWSIDPNSDFNFFFQAADNSVTALAELVAKRFVLGLSDGRIIVLSLKKDQRSEFVGHTQPIRTIKAFADGKFATMSEDNTIKIWLPLIDGQSVHLRATIPCDHQCLIRDMCILSNGYLAVCTHDSINSVIKIWNSDNGKLVKKISTHVADVCSMCVLSNDEIVIGSLTGVVKVVNLLDNSYSRTLVSPAQPRVALSVKELSNGLIVFVECDQSPRLQVWDPHACRPIQTIITGHSDIVHLSGLSKTGKYLFTASKDKTIKVWSIDV